MSGLYEIDFDCIQVITAVIAKQVGKVFRVEIRWGKGTSGVQI